MAEADLYRPIQLWIEGDFALVRNGAWKDTHRKAIITAQLDWIEGGRWMRPDLALVLVHRRRFETRPSLDLYTFEVKPSNVAPLVGLHQTLAHGRFADFVLFLLPEVEQLQAEVVAQAERFGVGLVTFPASLEWRGFKVHVQPRRSTPDADLRDQFLSEAMSESEAKEVLAWLGIAEVKR